MNIWTFLGPMIIQVVTAIINRKKASADGAVAAPDDLHKRFDDFAQQLERHVQEQAPQQGTAAATGGLITQIQALIAALKAHDVNAILTIIVQILQGS